MSKYILKDKKTKPKYKYMVRCLSSADRDLAFNYYLFNDYQEAYQKAKTLSIKYNNCFGVIEPFRNYYGEYMTKEIDIFWMGEHDNDRIPNFGLHYKFYIDAGEWVNKGEIK